MPRSYTLPIQRTAFDDPRLIGCEGESKGVRRPRVQRTSRVIDQPGAESGNHEEPC